MTKDLSHLPWPDAPSVGFRQDDSGKCFDFCCTGTSGAVVRIDCANDCDLFVVSPIAAAYYYAKAANLTGEKAKELDELVDAAEAWDDEFRSALAEIEKENEDK